MTIKNLFPLGIATGAAHCNRSAERRELKNNILNTRHTWLWARRRFGKTSLVEQVLGELRRGAPAIPAAKLDLNVVHDAESLEERVRESAARLATAFLPKTRQKTKALLDAFARFKPEISIGVGGTNLTLRKPDSLVSGISDVLLGLDDAAAAYKRKGVVVLDEFQQLSSLTYGKSDFTLEGAIRHAVERAKQITYVFSGSERHLLADMFENADRPLYRLCQKMTLTRIATDDYRQFLDRASRSKWQKPLPDATVATILERTHRHPYYVNALCSRLWDSKTIPTDRSVKTVWHQLAEQDTAVVSHFVRNLSATQRAMLVGIAKSGQVTHPTGREFLTQVRLSASTGSVAKDVLEQSDLIRQNDDDSWELVDPVMEYYIRSHIK